MKIRIVFFTLLFVSLFGAQANDKPQGKFDFEKFKAEKISFFTSALDLTPKEAEVFWPVYNEFESKKWEISKQRRELDQSLMNGVAEMSDKEYTELSRKIVSLFIEDNKLTEEYNERFLKILPPKKVVMLYVTEMNFRNHLLRKYRGDENHERNKNK
ncbi:MAG: hypothetical protein JW735_03770 [Prolixibacteraceae bacterium]|jgi:hypothetical protein|nr:hypothetical protein [Prolixibacteraceae bacterium]